MSEVMLTRRLVAHCLNVLPSRIDEAALGHARRCLIDSLAVAIAASNEEPITVLRSVSADGRRPEEASLIGLPQRTTADAAALVNGMMIGLLQFDDGNGPMRGHPSAPVLPVALAIGESRDLSLRTTLEAFIVGYEVECQLGLWLNPSQYEVGWHGTAIQGTMGATVTAALLLGLDAEKTTMALGIAASLAGGIRRNFGSMTMSLHSGQAASAGCRAALMASRGFTADPDIFAGELSFGHVISREWDEAGFAASIETWGAPLAINNPGPIFRLYPCGRQIMPVIDCLMEMRRKHGLTVADVEMIECRVSYMYPRTLIHPRPKRGLQGKTSLEYCVAATLVDDGPRFSSFTDEAVLRPEITALIERVKVTIPPELSEDVPDVRRRPFEQPVTVTVRTHSGATYQETVKAHRGTPENPADDRDFRGKFLGCAEGRMNETRVDRIIDYVRSGDRTTARGLFALVNGGTA